MLSSLQPQNKPNNYQFLAIIYNYTQQPTTEFYNHSESTHLRVSSGVTQFRLMSNRGSGWFAENHKEQSPTAEG